MAVTSVQFQHLEARYAELKTKFLDQQIVQEQQDPLNFQADLDQLAAFRLLMHAEVEDYLERKAKDAAAALRQSISTTPFSRDIVKFCVWTVSNQAAASC
jgi:hypothetical protein